VTLCGPSSGDLIEQEGPDPDGVEIFIENPISYKQNEPRRGSQRQSGNLKGTAY